MVGFVLAQLMLGFGAANNTSDHHIQYFIE